MSVSMFLIMFYASFPFLLRTCCKNIYSMYLQNKSNTEMYALNTFETIKYFIDPMLDCYCFIRWLNTDCTMVLQGKGCASGQRGSLFSTLPVDSNEKTRDAAVVPSITDCMVFVCCKPTKI